MVDRFPLLDGSELDLDADLGPLSDEDRTIVLRNDYAEESLDWWETYATDNGPASPSLSGLAASGGLTTVSLDTGSSASGDVTRIEGPTVNYDNWTEVRAYLWGMEGDTSSFLQSLIYGDGASPSSLSNGINAQIEDNGGHTQVYAGGNEETNATIFANNVSVGPATKQAVGLRIYDADVGSGPSIEIMVNGRRVLGTNSVPFPASDYTFYHSVETTDGASHSRSADGWLIELIP